MFNFLKNNSKIIEETKLTSSFLYDYVFMNLSYAKYEPINTLKTAIEDDSDKFIEFRYEIFAFFVIALGSYLQSLDNRSLSKKLRDALYQSAINLVTRNSEKIIAVMFIKTLDDWDQEIKKIETDRGYQMNDLYNILLNRYKNIIKSKNVNFDIKLLGKNAFYNAMEEISNKFPVFSKELFG
jgi:hypothetical protein